MNSGPGQRYVGPDVAAWMRQMERRMLRQELHTHPGPAPATAGGTPACCQALEARVAALEAQLAGAQPAAASTGCGTGWGAVDTVTGPGQFSVTEASGPSCDDGWTVVDTVTGAGQISLTPDA